MTGMHRQVDGGAKGNKRRLKIKREKNCGDRRSPEYISKYLILLN